ISVHHHLFFFKYSVDHQDLHSFPTRRSSDLESNDSISNSTSPERMTILCGVVFAWFLTGAFWFSGAPGPTSPCGRTTMPPSSLRDRKSTRLNSSHLVISYAVFCLKKKKYIYL